ncbi:MAG: insulinase family protein [Propionibacteriaceae bacterium]|jgi:predicted Zn-dependent peptidase|nr:insulinase family protein [Propionibacteriaceae bacterium]
MTPRPPHSLNTGWHFPTPALARLDNGLAVWDYHLPGQYVATATLVIDLPLTAEPPLIEGVAGLAARGVDEGTLEHPGLAYAALLEGRGAQYSGWVGSSASIAQVEVPAQWFADGLSAFAEGVMAPAYDEADVARLVANRLAELDQLRAASGRLASWLIRETVLDPDQRAARLVGGSHATAAAITADAVTAFHAAHWAPAQSVLIVAGDLGPLDVAEAADAAFGAWSVQAAPAAHEPIRPAGPRRRLVHRPGAVQADIRLGWPDSVDASDPLYPAFQVAATAMGGGFSSRLNQSLREDKGWTYDVSLRNHIFRRGGYVTVSTSTRTALAGDVIAEALRLTDLGPAGFTQEEIDEAVGFLVGVAPLSFSTADAVAGHAADGAAHGQDHLAADRFLQATAQVTPDQATEAWHSVMSRREPSLVVLGDADALAGPLGLEPEPIPEL